MVITKKTIEELNDALKEIAPNVTERLRLEAALEFDCSYITITRYLRGEAKKPRLAEKLLSFFTKDVK
jgi:hypothetical protein